MSKYVIDYYLKIVFKDFEILKYTRRFVFSFFIFGFYIHFGKTVKKHDFVNYFLTLVMTRAGHEKLTPGNENFTSDHVKTIPGHKTSDQSSEKNTGHQNCRPVLVMDWSYHLQDPTD